MATYNLENPFERVKFRGQERKYFMVDFGLPRFSEIDGYQVMWNGHYVNYFENSRVYYNDYLKLGTQLFEDYGFQVPVHSYNVQMRNVVVSTDRIRVGVRPMYFKKGLLELFHLLMVGNEVRAQGSIIHAVIMKDTRMIPYPMPPIVNQIIGRIFAPFKEDLDPKDFGLNPEVAWS